MAKRTYKVIGVLGNKGGVGKTLTTTSIAHKISKMDVKVGLLDGDVDSPSVPRMLGMSDYVSKADSESVKPGEYSPTLRFVSIGSHTSIIGNKPTVWRGEKHREFIVKCITEVGWGDIEILIVDFPAGIGDVPIALNKFFGYLDGVVFVSIPSKVSTDSCEKAITMAEHLKLPIIGMVENMAYFMCDKCGARHDIYGNSGAKALAQKHNIEFLGEIPLLKEISANNDVGKPIDNEVITKIALKIVEQDKSLFDRLKDRLR